MAQRSAWRSSWWVLSSSLADWICTVLDSQPCLAPAPLYQSTECIRLEDMGHNCHMHLLSLVAGPVLNPAEMLSKFLQNAKWRTETVKCIVLLQAACQPVPRCWPWYGWSSMPSPLPNESAVMSPRGRLLLHARCELTEHLPGKTGRSWEREVSQEGTRQRWQPWGPFTVPSSDRSQHLQRVPWPWDAWCQTHRCENRNPLCGHCRCLMSSEKKMDWLICLLGLLFILPRVMDEFSKERRREGTIGFAGWSVSCRVAEPASRY